MADSAATAASARESDHSTTVRQEVARQAPTFAQDDSFFASERLARWILRTVSLEGVDIALEVACGASHFGEVMAAEVRQVVGLDLTPEMLATGQQRLAGRGVGNVLLQTGDVARLPFLDGSFDLVFCRFAVHHFDAPAQAIAEIALDDKWHDVAPRANSFHAARLSPGWRDKVRVARIGNHVFYR